MDFSKEKNTKQEHISAIYKEYTTPSRVLKSFTNLSNTVIQTALSGQNKFIYELLQNADDSYDQQKVIEAHFILEGDYLIVYHNGKCFDFSDVERICDYASQIEEVKANDLSKTGYKGLGFKSLFNLTDCIYIYSNGYCFRFDKMHWSDSSTIPWQVIPIWCAYDELPMKEKYQYKQPVNFVLKVNDVYQIQNHLKELLNEPEVLLYLNRINKLTITVNGERHVLERIDQKYGTFTKMDIYDNSKIVSTWLLRTFKQTVPSKVQKNIQGATLFIYPDKIKNAKEVSLTFALKSNETLTKILKVKGLCHCTLPTQLHLAPYHINSSFILTLDRTQLHENKWNEFLLYQIGYLQLNMLKDLAHLPDLKNYTIMLLVREIDHLDVTFRNSFLQGFNKAKNEIAWLPAFKQPHLLKLGEAWTDETKFFEQNFQNIEDAEIQHYLIDYNVENRSSLSSSEANIFKFKQLFKNFPSIYYFQLTKPCYTRFISYLYESLKNVNRYTGIFKELQNTPFLLGKENTLLSPVNAILEERRNPIPDFLELNPVNNDYLPTLKIDLIKKWLVILGAQWLKTPIAILRESILKWINSKHGLHYHDKYRNNHIEILNRLSESFEDLTQREINNLRANLIILTGNNEFKLAESCYFPDAVSVAELSDVLSENDKISSCYNISKLRKFFIKVGVNEKLYPLEVLRKTIIKWIHNCDIDKKLATKNYIPIIEYISQHYYSIERYLDVDEKNLLNKMPILTCSQKYMKASDCYFDFAICDVKGFEDFISDDELVKTTNISDPVQMFLKKIGVSEKISPKRVLQRIAKWIEKDEIREKITLKNHLYIIRYIADNYYSVLLEEKEKKSLKKIPILTKMNTFEAACSCFCPNSDGKEIPGVESVISANHIISTVYDSKENNYVSFLKSLGVQTVEFTTIYEKYIDYLTCSKNIEWFFSKLIEYWNRHKDSLSFNKLLKYLQQKFTSLHYLRAKDGRMFHSSELYSAKFKEIHSIDPSSMPLLDFEGMPEDLEKWLGFKTSLTLTFIVQLLESVAKFPILGEDKTLALYTTLLEQLREKKKDEIKMYQLCLFSKKNKLVSAKDLYYFIEEDATCFSDSCYLKRIHGMTHEDMLELAKLCGVNTLEFNKEINLNEEEMIIDNTLRYHYLERLPFIVLQESKEFNESPTTILRNLYDKIDSLKVLKCSEISIKYPFGDEHNISFHGVDQNVYFTGKWSVRKFTTNYGYLKKILHFKSNIENIVNMEIDPDEEKEWLQENNINAEELDFIKNELQKLQSGQMSALVQYENNDQSHHSVDIEKDVRYEKTNKNESVTGEANRVIQSSFENDSDTGENRKEEMEQYENNDQSHHSVDIEKDVRNKKTNKNESVTGEANRVIQPFFENDSDTGENRKEEMEQYENNDQSHHSVNNQVCPTYHLSHKSKVKRYPEVTVELLAQGSHETKKRCIYNSYDTPNIAQQSELPISNHSTQDSITYLGYSQEMSSEEYHLKWLGEKYVFTFLQDHYKNKYPKFQFNLSGGVFIIYCKQSFAKIEIVWLNESEEQEKPYDLLLKKDGKIKQIIEVETTDSTKDALFNLNHREIMRRMTYISMDMPEYKEKFMIYRVFNMEKPTADGTEKLDTSPVAFHKLVPLKILKM